MRISFAFFIIGLPIIQFSCLQKQKKSAEDLIAELNLKKGEIISCGPPDQQLGSLFFETGCKENADFQIGVKLLHSFEYDEAEKAFTKVIYKDPDCAMAYWGIAMSNFHPLWMPPTEEELIKGSKSLKVAEKLQTNEREKRYLEAITSFYHQWETIDHHTRCLRFEKSMQRLMDLYPNDKETSIFYALSLIAAADPKDKTYTKQKKAGALLEKLYPENPNHPGVVHYLIHAYDSPILAPKALAAARNYALIAPSSAHALHMPSHIFTRLGMWSESAQSNRNAAQAAICYAESTGINGHWDEELHCLDYLMYAYLQNGKTDSAKSLLTYLQAIKNVSPINDKVAYAFAAIPSRFVLENKMWNEAPSLLNESPLINWQKYPWQKSILHFSRLMTYVNMKKVKQAHQELDSLKQQYSLLIQSKDQYKAYLVQVQVMSGQAWILLSEGKSIEALKMMNSAADLEDVAEKLPVSPSEVLPARELLADMYQALGQSELAIKSYQQVLEKHPNRLNSVKGAAGSPKNTDSHKLASR